MSDASSLLAILVAYSAILIIPGQNFILIGWLSRNGSRAAGLYGASGIMLATGFWIALAMLGAGPILSAHAKLVAGLQLLAAACLIWLGLNMIRTGPSGLRGQATVARRRAPFAAGLATAMANPLAALFWASTVMALLPQKPSSGYYAALFVSIITMGFLWYITLTLLFSAKISRPWLCGLTRHMNLLAGAAMIAVAWRAIWQVWPQVAAGFGG